jgi:hypothetical protein
MKVEPPSKEQLAEARERNLARRKHAKDIASAKGGEHRVVGKSAADSVKLDRIISSVTGRFLEECEGGAVLGGEINWLASESLRLRRDQINTVKDYMAMIRQLHELREVIADKEAKGKKANPMSTENVILLQRAEDLLKKHS